MMYNSSCGSLQAENQGIAKSEPFMLECSLADGRVSSTAVVSTKSSA